MCADAGGLDEARAAPMIWFLGVVVALLPLANLPGMIDGAWYAWLSSIITWVIALVIFAMASSVR